jgi:hypothetical protein
MSPLNSSDRSNSTTVSTDFLNPPMCADIIEAVQCTIKADRIICNDRPLVLYCSQYCQSSHAGEHRANTFKHEYMSQQWKPQWFVERRAPNIRPLSPEPR